MRSSAIALKRALTSSPGLEKRTIYQCSRAVGKLEGCEGSEKTMFLRATVQGLA